MIDNAKKYFQNNKKITIAVALAVVILAIIIATYMSGYRFTSNFGIGKQGLVSMTIPLPQTSVFIDEKEKITTTKDNEMIKIPFSPSEHRVIVSREGYYPWTKSFILESGENAELHPILIAQNPSGQIITKKDPEYTKLRNEITNDPLPTKQRPRMSNVGNVVAWVENNSIKIQVGQSIYDVVTPKTSVKNLYFYKDRNDSLIFSTGEFIFVIETDTAGTQNFIPLLKGTKPVFIEKDPNSIYVQDGESLMQVVI